GFPWVLSADLDPLDFGGKCHFTAGHISGKEFSFRLHRGEHPFWSAPGSLKYTYGSYDGMCDEFRRRGDAAVRAVLEAVENGDWIEYEENQGSAKYRRLSDKEKKDRERALQARSRLAELLA
ncbi:hypothetical protein FOZ63_023168, partial [Perkinsus olseni]